VLLQSRAVRQIRELIMLCQISKTRLRRLAIGYILDNTDDLFGTAVGAKHDSCAVDHARAISECFNRHLVEV